MYTDGAAAETSPVVEEVSVHRRDFGGVHRPG